MESSLKRICITHVGWQTMSSNSPIRFLDYDIIIILEDLVKRKRRELRNNRIQFIIRNTRNIIIERTLRNLHRLGLNDPINSVLNLENMSSKLSTKKGMIDIINKFDLPLVYLEDAYNKHLEGPPRFKPGDRVQLINTCDHPSCFIVIQVDHKHVYGYEVRYIRDKILGPMNYYDRNHPYKLGVLTRTDWEHYNGKTRVSKRLDPWYIRKIGEELDDKYSHIREKNRHYEVREWNRRVIFLKAHVLEHIKMFPLCSYIQTHFMNLNIDVWNIKNLRQYLATHDDKYGPNFKEWFQIWDIIIHMIELYGPK